MKHRFSDSRLSSHGLEWLVWWHQVPPPCRLCCATRRGLRCAYLCGFRAGLRLAVPREPWLGWYHADRGLAPRLAVAAATANLAATPPKRLPSTSVAWGMAVCRACTSGAGADEPSQVDGVHRGEARALHAFWAHCTPGDTACCSVSAIPGTDTVAPRCSQERFPDVRSPDPPPRPAQRWNRQSYGFHLGQHAVTVLTFQRIHQTRVQVGSA